MLNSKLNTRLKQAAPWLVVVLVLVLLWLSFGQKPSTRPSTPVSYSQLLEQAQRGQVATLVLRGNNALAVLRDERSWEATVPNKETALLPAAIAGGAQVLEVNLDAQGAFVGFLSSWGPTLLLLGVLVYIGRRRNAGAAGGTSGLLAVGRSKARLLAAGSSTVTFADVAGCDEAKQDVKELVDFLREPKKFEALGGRIPRGVLLDGPPGTGKTLLARAIAGEAGVPFFSISGSDFVEMLVGVGASRVRDLFSTAKNHAPCIVFIDEIDAVGRQRGAGHGGGNDEREQTLNQMLVEMDGFEPGAGVIVLAATNRADILDTALLRPGRFDRQVTVGLPDVRGREQILAVHLRKVPIDATVEIPVLAKGTPGFSGADLANLVNEAALLAARTEKRFVGAAELERAKDKLLMGPERHSLRMSEQEKSVTAYHEAGHALVAKLLLHTDPVHKVSIIPRGRALGVTVQLPASERYSLGRLRILDTIAVLFGGRVAEELFMADVTTGASNDLERATLLAHDMVALWGMNLKVGLRVVDPKASSPEMRALVDVEVSAVLQEQYERVQALLIAHAPAMHALHDALMLHETIDGAQVDEAVARTSGLVLAPSVRCAA